MKQIEDTKARLAKAGILQNATDHISVSSSMQQKSPDQISGAGSSAGNSGDLDLKVLAQLEIAKQVTQPFL
jgi:hypothetical protein